MRKEDFKEDLIQIVKPSISSNMEEKIDKLGYKINDFYDKFSDKNLAKYFVDLCLMLEYEFGTKIYHFVKYFIENCDFVSSRSCDFVSVDKLFEFFKENDENLVNFLEPVFNSIIIQKNNENAKKKNIFTTYSAIHIEEIIRENIITIYQKLQIKRLKRIGEINKEINEQMDKEFNESRTKSNTENNMIKY